MDYIQALQARQTLTSAAHQISRDYDAIVMPTSAIAPPALSALEQDADYARLNMLALRNTSIGNFLDRCAISIPASVLGDAPVGFMLMGEHGADMKLFADAMSVEACLARR